MDRERRSERWCREPCSGPPANSDPTVASTLKLQDGWAWSLGPSPACYSTALHTVACQQRVVSVLDGSLKPGVAVEGGALLPPVAPAGGGGLPCLSQLPGVPCACGLVAASLTLCLRLHVASPDLSVSL